jgi:hypothetical protein
MNSYPIITVTDETYINVGNTGTDVRWWQAQEWRVDFATPSGIYRPAPKESDVSFRHTSVFYVSGVVVEAGYLVNLTPNGNVPAEYNGKVLTSDAVVVTPEIFLSKYNIPEDPDADPDPTPRPPRAQDGKVAIPEDVFFLLHADMNIPNWIDSSTYGRALTQIGFPELEPVRTAFGSGSLKGPPNSMYNGLRMDSYRSEEWDLADPSFTFEARFRFDSTDPAVHTLLSYGREADRPLLEITARFGLDELMVPTQSIRINWVEAFLNPNAEPGDPDEFDVLDEVEIVLDGSPWLASPGTFQQTSLTYDSVSGRFAVHVDGVRVGYLRAAEREGRPWNGVTIAPYVEPADPADIDLQYRVLVVGASCRTPETGNPPLIGTEASFVGLMDEVRLTMYESLYDVESPAAQVYSFAWPNPIATIDAGVIDPGPPPEEDPP